MSSNKRLIICAAPAGVGTGSNFGMQTVDFAAHNLIKRLGLEQKAEIHRPWPALSPELGGDPQTETFDRWPTEFTTSIDRGQIKDGDLVLTWGDFQLGHDYQIQSAKRYSNIQKQLGRVTDSDQAMDWALDYFLMRKALDKKITLGCFGTTLFQNSVSDWVSEPYRGSLETYLSSCSFMKFRDPYSSWSISRMMNQENQSLWGVDCALLNTREELLSLPRSEAGCLIEPGSVGVYFGRSSKKFSYLALGKFLKKASKVFEADLDWIPWNQFSGGKLFARRPRLLSKPMVNIG